VSQSQRGRREGLVVNWCFLKKLQNWGGETGEWKSLVLKKNLSRMKKKEMTLRGGI